MGVTRRTSSEIKGHYLALHGSSTLTANVRTYMKLRTRAGVGLLALAVGSCLGQASLAFGASAGWEQWQHLEGVVDVAGPRTDGKLVAVAAGRLLLVSPDGTITPFSRGVDGYVAAGKDDEAYVAMVPVGGLTVDTAGCSFNADDVFVLHLGSPQAVDRVDPAGHSQRFAVVPDVEMLNGIALDTTGRFGHRLLVSGSHAGGTKVAAIDCKGGVSAIRDMAPQFEGGLAVAPASFGHYAGQLIAPDENSGRIWAIASDGKATEIARPELPTGGDTGVESLGFVPPGFARGGRAYLADRGTADNPFPGTDSILRLSASTIVPAGVAEGDLLVSTEGNGTTVAIHCEASCQVLSVADGPKGGHIEGHIALVADQPAPSGAALSEASDLGRGGSGLPVPVAATVAAALAGAIGAAGAVLALRHRNIAGQ